MKTPVVLPSVLSFDFRHIENELARMEKAGLSFLHYDVMDGRFVPDISFGEAVFAQLVPAGFKADVHLMVADPLPHVKNFFALKAAEVTVHFEAIEKDVFGFLDQVGPLRKGRVLGLAFNPDTPLTAIAPLLPYFDKVMAMTVFPGRSGQSFVAGGVARVARLCQLAAEANPRMAVEVDGGITDVTGPLCVKAGARLLVSGSFLCRADDPARAAAAIRGTGVSGQN